MTTGPVQTIDVLPTIADALGVRLPWKVDGRPAEQAPRNRPAVDMLTRDWEPLRVDAASLERRRRAALDRKLQLFGDGLYSTDALVGRPVSAFAAAAAGATATIDVTSELEDVDLRGPLPTMITGTIAGAGAGRHDLALAVNGRIATTAQSFPWEGDERFSAFVPPDALRAGRNAVEVRLVPRSGLRRALTIGLVASEKWYVHSPVRNTVEG